MIFFLEYICGSMNFWNNSSENMYVVFQTLLCGIYSIKINTKLCLSWFLKKAIL